MYASHYMWGTIFGSFDYCAQVATGTPLWYARYDNNPSFSDFLPFGGWKVPNVKQYKGTSELCGASVDRNYRP